MSNLRLSHTQRECYTLCGKKYYYRYVKKLRPKAKGSALYFGTAFDNATERLLTGVSLAEVEQKFLDEWMAHEGNYNVKFSKTDYTSKVLSESDVNKLESVMGSMPSSKEKTEAKGVIDYIAKLVKTDNNQYVRDLKPVEEEFLHLATLLSMYRKGVLMLRSFNDKLLPLVTEVIATQYPIDIKHPEGHNIIGYIDLVCVMEGFRLPNGYVLTKDDVVIIDIKSAGPMSWKKYDDTQDQPQLDTYLAALTLEGKYTPKHVGYFVTSKTVANDAIKACTKCGHIKDSMHRTCNKALPEGRCGGDWDEINNFYSESKAVVAERNTQEALIIMNDFDDTLVGIQAGVFPRNRSSCEAFGGICEYKNGVCGKFFKSVDEEEAALQAWKDKYGE